MHLKAKHTNGSGVVVSAAFPDLIVDSNRALPGPDSAGLTAAPDAIAERSVPVEQSVSGAAVVSSK